MKKIVLLALFATAALFFAGCTSINTSDAGSMNVYPATVGPVDSYRPLYKVNEKERVSGQAQVNVLFGLFAWGDTSAFADNATLSASDSVFGALFAWLPNAKEIAARAAFYNACTSSKCDAVVAARYEIQTDDYFVFKKMNVKVTGFPATLTGVEIVKPMPFYINGKGEVVVMDKFVVPHKLFDATVSQSGWWF
ncbi:hypothetical protein [uncultured Victivallis sp.]|uniref:hypothetical protein n=1 Tax=uncultured Victivallis sp. TaxID=354118 RepID=UPI0025D65FE5|nr:hypothetical protein [uncultured Victivallis sp.]